MTRTTQALPAETAGTDIRPPLTWWGLDGTLASYRETVKMALVHIDTTGQSERVVDAIRATAADTEGWDRSY
jgi:hypothetical protein